MCCISGKFYSSKQDSVKDFCKGHELRFYNKTEFMNKLITSVVLLSWKYARELDNLFCKD